MPKKRPHGRGKGKASRTHQDRQGRRSRNPRVNRTGPPDLLSGVRQVLSEEHPLGLLGLVSSMLAVVDPRRRSPFDGMEKGDQQVSRDELVESFLGVPAPETSALLAVMAEVVGDDLLRARIRRELASRPYDSPDWLAGLSDVAVYRAVEMVHVLGDGDNVMLGARLPDGHEFTCVVYIDHNLGTLVKDAFVVPEPIADLTSYMRAKTDDPDTRWDELDLADARERIREAIDLGVMTVPPCETDTWPACRALVEWVNGLLPDSGTGYERPEWDAGRVAALADRFFASSYGSALDDDDHRMLLDSLLWFGTDYGPGDPLRWSPVSVEILLTDWIPRKIAADVAYLAKAPGLLRAFIRFCHGERGIRASLTTETLAAVDQWEPEYQQMIRSPRPQGPAALLAALGALDADEGWTVGEELESFEEIMLDTLRRAVGGDDQLDKLDDVPLPDQAFGWDGIPDDIRDRVDEVVALVDRCCDEMLNPEYRTACRRLLAQAAAGDPSIFRRRGRADTAAAAVVWIAGKANDLFATYNGGGGMLVKDLMSHFGRQQSGVSQRATTLLGAGGFETDQYGSMHLGSPDYLTSSRRRRILELRDHYRAAKDS